MDPLKLPFKVLPELTRVTEAIHTDICERRAGKGGANKEVKSKRRKLKERDPWG